MSVRYGEWRHNGRRYNIAFADNTLFIERQDKPNLVGGIARGKVDRILGKAAFVRLPNQAIGYLETKRPLRPGDELLMQVSAYATEDKAWPLSTELKLQGRYYIHLPYGHGIAASKRLDPKLAANLKEELVRDFPERLPGGWIIRSGGGALSGYDQRLEAMAEVKALIERAKTIDTPKLGWLIEPPSVRERAARETSSTHSEAITHDDVADMMERLLQLNIPLDHGGRLRLGPTPACFTIDVDAGIQTDMDEFALEAAGRILGLISQLAVGGQIVIDPVRAAAKALLAHLQAFNTAWNSGAVVHGLTKMGLIELSRPRTGPSLYEALDD